MVKLTTVSLEPELLSSCWKSGLLPTSFTPTVLSEPRWEVTMPLASKVKKTIQEREEGDWTEEVATAELLQRSQ